MTATLPISPGIHSRIEATYRTDSRRVFATLVRLLRDFDLAEEALSDAFASAVERWPNEGVPENPTAWLVSAGRFKAIDSLRRRGRFDAMQTQLADRWAETTSANAARAAHVIEDDRLRLVFACCHPAIDRVGASAADLARGLRPHDGGDRRGVFDRAGGDGPADRPRQGEDPRRAHPLRDPGRRRLGRPPRLGVGRRLPRLQRGLFSQLRQRARPRRPHGRGDPARAINRRTVARFRSDRVVSPDAPARVPPPRAGDARMRR